MKYYYAFWMYRSPRKMLSELGIENIIAKFKCNIKPVWRTGGFRLDFTKKPYGYLISEEDAMALKLLDWCPDAIHLVMKIEASTLAWFTDTINDIECIGRVHQANQSSRYQIRKFIGERLVDKWW